jgi:hypothetical protein
MPYLKEITKKTIEDVAKRGDKRIRVSPGRYRQISKRMKTYAIKHGVKIVIDKDVPKGRPRKYDAVTILIEYERLRKQKGSRTQYRIAQKLGIPPSQLSKILQRNGVRHGTA